MRILLLLPNYSFVYDSNNNMDIIFVIEVDSRVISLCSHLHIWVLCRSQVWAEAASSASPVPWLNPSIIITMDDNGLSPHLATILPHFHQRLPLYVKHSGKI